MARPIVPATCPPFQFRASLHPPTVRRSGGTLSPPQPRLGCCIARSSIPVQMAGICTIGAVTPNHALQRTGRGVSVCECVSISYVLVIRGQSLSFVVRRTPHWQFWFSHTTKRAEVPVSRNFLPVASRHAPLSSAQRVMLNVVAPPKRMLAPPLARQTLRYSIRAIVDNQPFACPTAPPNKITGANAGGRLWFFHKVFGGSSVAGPRRSVRALDDLPRLHSGHRIGRSSSQKQSSPHSPGPASESMMKPSSPHIPHSGPSE